MTWLRFRMAWLVVAAMCTVGPSAVVAADAGPETGTQVIVYGATPGGFCAAIAAAREGAEVVLLEPTGHVGGLSTGGLSHCDSNQMVRSTLMGLFHEWHTRIVADYTGRGLPAPYDPAKKDQARWTFEPHVAMRVTRTMLAEAGVTVLTDHDLVSVVKKGPRIMSLVTTQGRFSAQVFIDGTYEGDLMAAAGVDWTIGREGRDAFGEPLAGRQYPKQGMAIDGFDASGKPLPLVTATKRGDETAGDDGIMTYSFRLCLTRDPANRVPLPEPDHYDPARFELIRRYLQAGGKPGQVGLDLYPLPGGKFDGNNSIGRQFSIGLVGGDGGWHAADEAQREQIWEAHKQYTLEFLHFLRNDPALPPQIRNQYAGVGLCRDEFGKTDHFPPALYVRESRRLQGMYVISQRDIIDEPVKDDPIAISSFPIDSHDCRRVAVKGGGVVNEGTIFPVRRIPGQGYAYHVPYRAVLPKPEQCDNLLVPVALSCTHVGMSSLRIEGAWMVIGQGTGVAAALAAKRGCSVQNLDYPLLRDRLLAQGQVLELPVAPAETLADHSISSSSLAGVVLDDATAVLEGNWSQSRNFTPYIDQGYIFYRTADVEAEATQRATAAFRFQVPHSGRYDLRMAYSAHATRSRAVPVTVRSPQGVQRFSVDQTQPVPAATHFRSIGALDLHSEQVVSIEVSTVGTHGFVILDAFQLVPCAQPAVERGQVER